MTRDLASRACAAQMHKFIIRLIKIDQLIGEPGSRLREGDFIGIWRGSEMSIEDELKISSSRDNVALGHRSCSLFRSYDQRDKAARYMMAQKQQAKFACCFLDEVSACLRLLLMREESASHMP